MTWIEASGKTFEEALEAAARELGIPADQVAAEVVDEESTGFLGLGQHKVTIRAAATSEDLATGLESNEQKSDANSNGSKTEQVMPLLAKILDAMGFKASPRLVSETDEDILIDIEGESEDIGRLIGRHGQTLDALQYLLAVSLNRRGSLTRTRVTLDAEGYRERHQKMLETKALELAAEVKASGNEAVLEPQSPRDRRIIHMALADDPEIETYSEGFGEDRHIVISPKK